MTVSRSRATPLHDQIRRSISARIASGELAPGARLPSEEEYARQFGVSLAPVRQALLDLAAAGLVVRVKGRGTFVREGKLEESIHLLTSFTQSLRSRGIPFRMHVLDQRRTRAQRDVAEALGLRVGAPVVRLRRLAEVRGEPAALIDDHLPADRFGRLVEIRGFDEGRSLYATLEAEFGTRVGHARSTLELQRVDDAAAELLSVPSGTPALLVRSVTEDETERPVELSVTIYRADRFAFTIDSRRTATEPGP